MVDEGDGMAFGEAVKRVVVPLELSQEAFRMGGGVPPVGSDGEPMSQWRGRGAGGP